MTLFQQTFNSFTCLLVSRDVPDIRVRLAGYPTIFNIRLRFRPKWHQEPDISTG